MNIIQILSHPIRIKILQHLQVKGAATTKQLAELMPDVATPTLYRHINALLKEGILLVKEERPIRGSIERLLTVDVESLDAASKGDIGACAYQFFMAMYMQFHEYSCLPDTDPERDGLCLFTRMMKLTDERHVQMLQELAEVMNRYQTYENEENARSRNISLSAVLAKEES